MTLDQKLINDPLEIQVLRDVTELNIERQHVNYDRSIHNVSYQFHHKKIIYSNILITANRSKYP